MNPLLFPPTLIKRALEDLGAIADAARRLPDLEQQVIDRIDRIEVEMLTRADTIVAELAATRGELAPIHELQSIRKGIEPLDDDMRAVRESVDKLEPLTRQLNTRLGALDKRVELLREDLAPLGELAEKIPGVGS
jgi:chromosome segregation ATPase